jgi:hypothetical protein
VWLYYGYTLFDSNVWMLYRSLVKYNVSWLSRRSELPERAYSTSWHSGGLWQWWLVWRLSQVRNVLMTHTYIHTYILVWSILTYFYLILHPWKHGYSHQNYFDTMCSNCDVDKNAYFCNGDRYLLIQHKILVWNSNKWFNLILSPSRHKDRH